MIRVMPKERSEKMGKKSTIILSALMTMLASSLCFGMVTVAKSEDGNTWLPVEREEPRGFMWIPDAVRKPPRGSMYRVRTEIELVVDGRIIDLNRILLPPDTPIIDRRFQEQQRYITSH